MTTIKIASYNMRKGIGTDRRRSPERVLEVLREIDADVIALQEADRRFGVRAAVLTPHLLDEHSDWKTVPLAQRAASSGWHGNAILVRKDADIRHCQALHLPALEPRGAASCAVTVRGTTLRVIGMHLDLSGLWRRRQAHAILAHVDGCEERHPTVLMGDLNEWSAAQRLPARFRARLRHCADRPQLSRAPPGRAARPHHGQPRPEDRRRRRPYQRRGAHRVRSLADLGRAGGLSPRA